MNKWIQITNHKIKVSPYLVMKAVDHLSDLTRLRSRKGGSTGRKMVFFKCQMHFCRMELDLLIL